MKKLHTSFLLTFLTLLLLPNSITQTVVGKEPLNKPGIKKHYATPRIYDYTMPPKDSGLLKTNFLPSKTITTKDDLADWELLHLIQDSKNIQKIRLYGFGRFANGNAIDWSTDKASVLKVVREGLSPNLVRRLPYSDLSNARWQVGGGAHLGVLEITVNKKTIIIGVSQVGFYLGTWYGCSHHVFESWVLTKQLDMILKDITGKSFDKKTFATLSGEGWIEDSKAIFQKTSGSKMQKRVRNPKQQK